MLTRWTQHLTDHEKEAFKKEVLSAKRVLERLRDMLDEDMEMIERSECDQRSYGIANWSHLQAHRNGNKQTYTEVKKYLTLTERKINDRS